MSQGYGQQQLSLANQPQLPMSTMPYTPQVISQPYENLASQEDIRILKSSTLTLSKELDQIKSTMIAMNKQKIDNEAKYTNVQN